MRAGAGLVLAAGLLLPGCAGYWEKRGLDGMDPWRFRILGMGFQGSVQATHFLQLGLGFAGMHEQCGMGLVGRNFGLKPPPVGMAEAGLAPLVHYRAADVSRGIVLGRTSLEKYPMEKPLWTFFPSPIEYRRGYDRGLFEVGGSFYWIVGIDFGFDPLELVDFILGFTSLDIMKDDPSRQSGDESEPAGSRSPDST